MKKKKKKKKKKKIVTISVFGYKKIICLMYVSKKCFDKTPAYLLLIGEKGKRHYALIKAFNPFHTPHSGRNHCCLYK